MNIDRRHLVLPAIAVGLLGIVPTLAASADEDAEAEAPRVPPLERRASPRARIRRARRPRGRLPLALRGESATASPDVAGDSSDEASDRPTDQSRALMNAA